MFIKYMASEEVFEIFRNCRTHDDWKKRAAGSVELFYSVPMERGNHSVLKSLPDAAKQDLDLRKAVSAAKKKASKKKKEPSQPKDAQQMLLGPKPRGNTQKVDTILGPLTGFMKKDGSFWEFPPLDAAGRAAWPTRC